MKRRWKQQEPPKIWCPKKSTTSYSKRKQFIELLLADPYIICPIELAREGNCIGNISS